MAEIPADQVLSIESLALHALDEMRKFCTSNAGRERAVAITQKATPESAPRYAAQIDRLDAVMRKNQGDFAGNLAELRNYPSANVAQLLAERRRKVSAEHAQRLSLIEGQLAQGSFAAPMPGAGDCAAHEENPESGSSSRRHAPAPYVF